MSIERDLGSHDAGHGAQRVPAVKAAKRRAEPIAGLAQRADEHRQRGSHGRRRKHEQGERHTEAKSIDQGADPPIARTTGASRDPTCGNTAVIVTPATATTQFERGVGGRGRWTGAANWRPAHCRSRAPP